MAFPEDPLSARIDFLIDGVWVDVTSDVLLQDGLLHRRGRTSVLGGMDPAAGSFTLKSPNGKYSNRDPMSDYFGKLGRNTRMRVRLPGLTDQRFGLEVSEFAPRWAPGAHHVLMPITGLGILQRLGTGTKPLASTLARRVPSDPEILAYWPMEEGASATSAASPIAGVRPMKASGLTWASASDLPASAPLPVLSSTSGTASLSGLVPAPTGTKTGWHVQWVYRLDTPPTTLYTFMRIRTTGTVREWFIQSRDNLSKVIGRDADGVDVVSHNIITGADLFNQWTSLSFRTAQVGGTVDWQIRWQDVGGTAGALTASYVGTIGRVTEVGSPGSFAAPLDGMAIGHIGVFSTTDTTAYDGAITAYNGETAVSRMIRLAAEEGLDFSYVDGDLLASERVGPQRIRQLLELFEECAAVDGGLLFENREEPALLYRDRHSLYSQPPTLILDYALGQAQPPMDPTDDLKSVANDYEVTREGGSSGRAVQEEGPLSVLPPGEGGIGLYDQAVSLNLYADAQADQIAAWLVHLGTVDAPRIPAVRVLLHRHPSLIPAMLELDIGHFIRIINLPRWVAPSGILDLRVEGYSEDLRIRTWEVTLNCSPGEPWRIGELEDPVYSRADTDGSELAAGVSGTDTVLPVTVTAGPLWVTAAPNSVADPGFDQGTGAWACSRGASIGVVSWERSLVHSGAGAARMTRVHLTDTGTLNMVSAVPDAAPAAPGQVWTGSAWVYSEGAAANSMRTALIWRTSGGVDTNVSGTGVSTQAGDGWVRLSVSATAPAGTASVRLLVEGRSAWTVGEYWIADSPRLARTDSMVSLSMPDEFPFDVTCGGEQVTVTSITGVAEDSFGSTVASGWGTAGSGQPWATIGGSASDYAVASGTGRHAMSSKNVFRVTHVPVTTPDVDLRFDFSLAALPIGDSTYVYAAVRYTDDIHFYFARVQIDAAGGMFLTLRKRNGVETLLSPVLTTGYTYVAGTWYTVRVAMTGSTLTGKVWLRSAAEPDWLQSETDTDITVAGSVGVRTFLGGSASNVLPLTYQFDNLYADPQQMTVTRSVNGIVKPHAAGADIRLTYPTIVAL